MAPTEEFSATTKNILLPYDPPFQLPIAGSDISLHEVPLEDIAPTDDELGVITKILLL